MVKLKVKAKKLWSRRDRDAARAATQFAAEQFGLEGLKIVVKLNKDPFHCGTAVDLENGTYMILVSWYKDQDHFIKTVFHEMTHVAQYVFKGLEMTNDSVEFDGQRYKFSVDECTDQEYLDAPWEVEARAMEEVLFKLYNQ